MTIWHVALSIAAAGIAGYVVGLGRGVRKGIHELMHILIRHGDHDFLIKCESVFAKEIRRMDGEAR